MAAEITAQLARPEHFSSWLLHDPTSKYAALKDSVTVQVFPELYYKGRMNRASVFVTIPSAGILVPKMSCRTCEQEFCLYAAEYYKQATGTSNQARRNTAKQPAVPKAPNTRASGNAEAGSESPLHSGFSLTEQGSCAIALCTAWLKSGISSQLPLPWQTY